MQRSNQTFHVISRYKYHIGMAITAVMFLAAVLLIPMQSVSAPSMPLVQPSYHQIPMHENKTVSISMICSEVPEVSPSLTNMSEARKKWGEAINPLTLNRVCLDGEAIVVHEPALLERIEGGMTDSNLLPQYDASFFNDFHRHASRNTHPLRPIYGRHCQLNKLAIRFPSKSEVKEAKYFSKCTLPVILMSHWVSTFGEFFTMSPAWLWKLQSNQFEGPLLDRNITAVLASCNNFPLSPFHTQLIQPYTRFPVTSWTSFASPAASKANALEASQGPFRQCYEKVVILGIREASWGNAYEMAQHTLSYYKQRGQVPSMSGRLFSDDSPDVLRILFEYRTPEGGGQPSSHHGRVPPVEPLDMNDPEMIKEYLRSKHQYHMLDDVTGERKPMDEAEFKKRPIYPGKHCSCHLS